MRTVNAADEFEVAEEGDRLQRLAETLLSSESGLAPGVRARRLGRRRTHHLVCENTVDAVVVQTAHPVETLDLVLAHLSSFDDCVGQVSHSELFFEMASEVAQGLHAGDSVNTNGPSPSARPSVSFSASSSSASSSFSDLRPRDCAALPRLHVARLLRQSPHTAMHNEACDTYRPFAFPAFSASSRSFAKSGSR